MKRLFILMVLLVFAACACSPSMLTISEFKEKYDFHKEFRVKKNFQPVYKDLTGKASACFHEKNIISTSRYVDAEIYPKQGAAQLEFTEESMGMKEMWMFVDIVRLSNNLSKVVAYYRTPEDKANDIVGKWIKGENVCE